MADFETVGILGCGNMGGALARALAASGTVAPGKLHLYDADPKSLDALSQELGARADGQSRDLLARCDVLVLAVKPQVFPRIASDLAPPEGTKTVISVMAGVKTESLRSHFPPGYSVVRVMPNLPLSVGEGATAIETDGHPEPVLAAVERIFGAAGRTARVPAAQMDAVTALSGSGPMYVFEFLDGLIEAGVKAGLSRETAAALAAQTAKGAIKLLENGDETPSQWTAKVCSPGGTTLEALRVLEAADFKGLLAKAVAAAARRSRELSGG